MLNTIDLMALNAKYQKFRTKSLKFSAKNQWLFAYTAITETQIKPKREQFKWKNIKMITKTRREYSNLLKKKHSKGGKLTVAELESEIVKVFSIKFHAKS
jgi:hypothetical protein